MQLKQSNDVSQQYTGTIAGLKKIVKDEGLMGLYKGMDLNLLANNRCCTKIDSIGSQCCFPIHVQGILFQLE
jgi:Mitochondrial carrier protein